MAEGNFQKNFKRLHGVNGVRGRAGSRPASCRAVMGVGTPAVDIPPSLHFTRDVIALSSLNSRGVSNAFSNITRAESLSYKDDRF